MYLMDKIELGLIVAHVQIPASGSQSSTYFRLCKDMYQYQFLAKFDSNAFFKIFTPFPEE